MRAGPAEQEPREERAPSAASGPGPAGSATAATTRRRRPPPGRSSAPPTSGCPSTSDRGGASSRTTLRVGHTTGAAPVDAEVGLPHPQAAALERHHPDQLGAPPRHAPQVGQRGPDLLGGRRDRHLGAQLAVRRPGGAGRAGGGAVRAAVGEVTPASLTSRGRPRGGSAARSGRRWRRAGRRRRGTAAASGADRCAEARRTSRSPKRAPTGLRSRAQRRRDQAVVDVGQRRQRRAGPAPGRGCRASGARGSGRSRRSRAAGPGASSRG